MYHVCKWSDGKRYSLKALCKSNSCRAQPSGTASFGAALLFLLLKPFGLGTSDFRSVQVQLGVHAQELSHQEATSMLIATAAKKNVLLAQLCSLLPPVLQQEVPERSAGGPGQDAAVSIGVTRPRALYCCPSFSTLKTNSPFVLLLGRELENSPRKALIKAKRR